MLTNQNDPVTPLANGELVHSYFPNSSALLVQNGSGVSLVFHILISSQQH